RRATGGSTSHAAPGSRRWASRSRRCSSSPPCSWFGPTAPSTTLRCSRCRSGGRASKKCSTRSRRLLRRAILRAETLQTRVSVTKEAFIVRRICLMALLLSFAGAIGIPVGFALSQAAAQMRVRVLLQHRATDIPLPANLEVRDDRWDPGAETGEHEHPGPVVLVVIDGELAEETAAGRNVLRAGQAFWRPAREKHNVKNLGSRTARVLAIHFDPVQ